MDLNDSPAEAAYRAEARRFLAAHAAPCRLDLPGISKRLTGPELLAAAKEWQALKADNGYACITWPTEWGGRGGSAVEGIIFDQEEANFDVPTGIFQVGLGMCVPTLIQLGDDDVRRRFVRPAMRGEEIWCQLFSEPSAGSDLAGLRMRAQADGGDWVINGEKVWTTNAHIADFGLLLVRSDPDQPKHKGLTMFWVDMRSPGIEVRPIHQISGRSSYNNVFFTDVRIPDTQRVGAVGGGWKAALVTLMNERLAIGGTKGADWREILELAQRTPAPDGRSMAEDRGFRQRLADWYVEAEGTRLTRFRTMTALSRGETPGPESSIGKLVNANRLQDLCGYAVEMQGLAGLIDDPAEAAMAAVFQQGLMKAPGSRVAGGTDEILRNIIAERVLALPPEIRKDRDVPFRVLP